MFFFYTPVARVFPGIIYCAGDSVRKKEREPHVPKRVLIERFDLSLSFI